jgi:transcriptional regulator with XRE-family HTH domain
VQETISLKTLASECLKRTIRNVPSVFRGFEELSLSDKKLAQKIGVSQPTVSDWHSGRKPVSPCRHQQLLELLALSVSCAMEVLAETATEQPDLINSDGFKCYTKRLSRARAILLQFQQEEARD